MYKKIYVEITNNCNLKCDFCIKNTRKTEYIEIEKFEEMLNKIDGYTNYLYFHILGEPLMHPKINELIDIAAKKFKINITTNGYLIDRIKNNTTLTNNIFVSKINEFIWPDLDNKFENTCGKCYALKDHIGILVDGTIVPCCLDTKGIIKLGNIYKDELKNIIDSKRYKNMLIGFKKNKKTEKLCLKCGFLK